MNSSAKIFSGYIFFAIGSFVSFMALIVIAFAQPIAFAILAGGGLVAALGGFLAAEHIRRKIAERAFTSFMKRLGVEDPDRPRTRR